MRRNVKELVQLLDPDVQVDLMRRKARVERNHAMIQTYMLLQQERAQVQFMHKNVSIHQVHTDLLINKGGLSALIRTMTLPAPLVELVASFLPLPRLWDKRSALIVKRCTVDPDQAIASSLEIIDEVLDEGGFVDACDEAQVTPPTNFSSWVRILSFVLYLSHEWENILTILLFPRNSVSGKYGDTVSRKRGTLTLLLVPLMSLLLDRCGRVLPMRRFLDFRGSSIQVVLPLRLMQQEYQKAPRSLMFKCDVAYAFCSFSRTERQCWVGYLARLHTTCLRL